MSTVKHLVFVMYLKAITYMRQLPVQVADNMGLVDIPSAYQIRFGGVKGVVAVDPSMRGQIQLCSRPSMQKFDSQHSSLEILSIARPLPMYLNHQVDKTSFSPVIVGIPMLNLSNCRIDTIEEATPCISSGCFCY